MNKKSLTKKILVNVLAIVVYLLLERYYLKVSFSIWSIVFPILVMLPITILVKFKEDEKLP
jgi:ABC-type iron transport system FetAB permease component